MKASEGRVGRVFVLRLEDGDVLPGCVEQFAAEHGVLVGQVILVGGIGDGQVVVGPRRSQESPPEPMLLPIDGTHEVVGLGVLAPDESGKPTKRVVLKFHPRLAPIKAAVFPLVKKDGMPEVAREIYGTLKPHLTVFYDEKSAVGRRYRRQDEVGTPFCITVDGQTLRDGTVTIRDRDTLRQWRVKKEDCLHEIQQRLRS